MQEPRDIFHDSKNADECVGARVGFRDRSRERDVDSSLLEALRSGDSSAFSLLSERYRAYLFKVAFSVTMNREDAEDAIQCAFLQIHRHIDTFRGNSQFKTWITSIAINQSLMALRKRKRTMISIDDHDFGDENSTYYKLQAPGYTPEENYLKREAGDKLVKWVNNLSKSYREVADLHFLKDFSCQEIALILGLSRPAVKSRLGRARRDLLRTGTKHFRSRNATLFF